MVKGSKAWGREHGDEARKAGKARKARKGRSEGKGPLGTEGRRGGAERIDERSEVGGQRSENRGQNWLNGQRGEELRIADCGLKKHKAHRCDVI